MFEKRKRRKEPASREEKNIPNVRKITCWEKTAGDFYAPGALLQVENGKGLLYDCYSEEPSPATYCTLMLGDFPLFQLQGDEYFCPTCEKIIRSSYGLEQTDEFREERMNGENVSFSEALEGLRPLLGLLEDNCYVVLDTQLFPTDGNGHVFWNVPESRKGVPGSCLFYRGDGQWGDSRPHFTVATQSIEKLCPSRVEYYRRHPGCRAVAYYMDGYMTALLDGHHKAMAAALDHRCVNALVIMPCHRVVRQERKDSGEICRREYLVSGDMWFSCEEYGVKSGRTMERKKPSPEKMGAIRSRFSRQEPPFPYDNDELAAVYPGASEASDIDAYTDKYGEITQEVLDQILTQEHSCTVYQIRALLRALTGLRHERLFDMADFFLGKCTYLSLLAIHDMETFAVIVEQLMKLPRTEELVQYMVNLMVEYEDEYPSVGECIKEWL